MKRADLKLCNLVSQGMTLAQARAKLEGEKPVEEVKAPAEPPKLSKKERKDLLKKEIEALERTLQKRDERNHEVNTLLRENVIAMVRLDQTAMDISTMETSEERASVDMEDAMNELLLLADQFKDFKTE